MTCPACGAASCGNLTCRTCRQEMRKTMPDSKFLDRLDEMNIETVPPVGVEEIQAFIRRLEGE